MLSDDQIKLYHRQLLYHNNNMIGPSSTIEKLLYPFLVHPSSYSSSRNDSLPQWSHFPGLPFALNIEANIDGFYHVKWLRYNWHFTIFVSIFYMIAVYLGTNYMKNRKAFDLRFPLALWSGALAMFSIIGTIRCVPEFVWILYRHGFIESFCNNSYREDPRLIFWYLMFIWSKLFELVDTAFIILRKQKLIHLHWFHHVITMVYCFFVFPDQPGTARWMVSMNFAIHSVMYSYFALRALRIGIPRFVAMVITISQILQMIFGLIINVMSFKCKWDNSRVCDLSLSSASAGLFVYGSFFILFINFFVTSYFARPSVNKKRVYTDCNDNAIDKKHN